MKIIGGKVVYLISGTSGVGKSSIAKEITHNLRPSALVMGHEVNFMLLTGSELPMEHRFSLTWKNIISLVTNFLSDDLNVVIEWVMQKELGWICEQLSGFNIQMKYVVLRADADTLRERLGKRGDSHLLDRSLFLLNQLDNLPQNKEFLYDTSGKDISEITKEIMYSDRYFIKKV